MGKTVFLRYVRQLFHRNSRLLEGLEGRDVCSVCQYLKFVNLFLFLSLI